MTTGRTATGGAATGVAITRRRVTGFVTAGTTTIGNEGGETFATGATITGATPRDVGFTAVAGFPLSPVTAMRFSFMLQCTINTRSPFRKCFSRIFIAKTHDPRRAAEETLLFDRFRRVFISIGSGLPAGA